MNNSPVTVAQAFGGYALFVIMSFTILFSIAGCGVIGIAACEVLSWFRVHRSDRAANPASGNIADDAAQSNLVRVASR